jgi:hypothetical protein
MGVGSLVERPAIVKRGASAQDLPTCALRSENFSKKLTECAAMLERTQ